MVGSVYCHPWVDAISLHNLPSTPQLSNEERVKIAKRVVEKASGRVPVVAGATFEGGLEEQAKLINEMGKFADAAVIITNQIATMEEVICVLLCGTVVHIVYSNPGFPEDIHGRKI